jgi:hypothetical protein
MAWQQITSWDLADSFWWCCKNLGGDYTTDSAEPWLIVVTQCEHKRQGCPVSTGVTRIVWWDVWNYSMARLFSKQWSPIGLWMNDLSMSVSVTTLLYEWDFDWATAREC